MIARLWRGRVPIARAREYRAYQQEVGPPGYRAVAGVRRIYMLGRQVDDQYEIAMLTFWDSLDAIRRFAGAPVDRARYYARDFEFLIEPPALVEHYDVLRHESLTERAETPDRVVRASTDGGPAAERDAIVRRATVEVAEAAAAPGNGGALVLGRDRGVRYEVLALSFWASREGAVGAGVRRPGAGADPALAVELFDVLAREMVAPLDTA